MGEGRGRARRSLLRPRTRVALALVAIAGGCVSNLSCASYADMWARLDDLEIPKRYERRADLQRGGAPLFGDYPTVVRSYWSPDDVETTCAELEKSLATRSPKVVRSDNACFLSFGIWPGLAVMATGDFHYMVNVSAHVVKDRRGTAVQVYVIDMAP